MSKQKPLILVVDDDPGLLKLVGHTLEAEGYRVATATDGRKALQLAEDEEPLLILLDVMMPGLDGFQVCERIRDFSQVPIIMLTAKDQTEDVVHGLDVGADDYVTKPFGVDELMARINAVLRRTTFPEKRVQPPFAAGDLRIDFTQQQVSLAREEVLLTPTEYRILSLLAGNMGKVFTQDHLLSEVWGPEYKGETHILQVTIARLRKKIGDDPSNPRYIVTRSGIGYSFKKPD